MPDDAIERAAEAIATRVVPGRVNADGQRTLTLHEADSWDAAKRAAMLAFASQQAPEGWAVAALRDVVNPLGKLRRDADAQGGALSGEAYRIANDLWFVQSIAKDALSAAMIDAAPSVTLGEVG